MVAVGDPVILARMPGYEVARTSVTADSATFTTVETTVASVTASLVSGVIYHVRFLGGWQTTVADSAVSTKIREDSASGVIRQFRVIQANESTGSFFHPFILEATYTAGSTGNKTFVGTGVRLSGTGSITLDAASDHPTYISVEVAS